VRPGYELVTGETDLLRRLRQLSARTIIVDIEPLVAYWDGTQDALDRGLSRILDGLSAIPAVRVVCFSTNSTRRPSSIPTMPGVQVEYLASAGKPLRIAPYQRFPRPGAVIGDQIVTDGILARRLGYTFLHYRPRPDHAPLGPRLLSGCGRLVRPFVFTRRGWRTGL